MCYGCQTKKRKKKEKANNKTQIRRHCMRRLFRSYTVWELIYYIGDHQTANRVKQNNNLKKNKNPEEENGYVFNHSQLGLKRPLIFWTRRLHLVFYSLSVFTHVTQTD